MKQFKLHYLFGEGGIEMTSMFDIHFSLWGLYNAMLKV